MDILLCYANFNTILKQSHNFQLMLRYIQRMHILILIYVKQRLYQVFSSSNLSFTFLLQSSNVLSSVKPKYSPKLLSFKKVYSSNILREGTLEYFLEVMLLLYKRYIYG